MRVQVAAFDFDGTLTRSDSVVPFLRRVAGSRKLVVQLARRAPSVIVAAARRDRDRLKVLATEAAFRGVPRSRVDALALEFGRTIAVRGLRDDVVARLGWHLEQGHRVAIVSASYEPYVRVVGGALGVTDVVAARLAVDGADVCTGELEGANCRAAEKVHRLDQWLSERGLARADVELWAYGDSAGDRELLAYADHPVWVHDPLDSVAPASA
ncbi:MAG TPA: HAD-IB family hydrolase [Ilumatobacter sp.]|nr:HAD-IB family hydrolase [Ilumatobacter sp.]